jgi:hypothetical protein
MASSNLALVGCSDTLDIRRVASSAPLLAYRHGGYAGRGVPKVDVHAHTPTIAGIREPHHIGRDDGACFVSELELEGGDTLYGGR